MTGDPEASASPRRGSPRKTGTVDVSRVLTADGSPPWPRTWPGQRLDQVLDDACALYGQPTDIAVDTGDELVSFTELDRRANQLARHLLERGVRPADRVALLLDAPLHRYVALVAAIRINAVYVPLDRDFGSDRIAFVLDDARVSTVLIDGPPGPDPTADAAGQPAAAADREGLARLCRTRGMRLVRVDDDAVRTRSPEAVSEQERGQPFDELACVIYTPDPDGRPTGVALEHPSICNFVRVASQEYGLRPGDRVYQGSPIAIDLAAQEIWVPWLVGATLVPPPPRTDPRGAQLHRLLTERRVSVLYCQPDLLAGLDEDLPGVRLLVVAGEACPPPLVVRWLGPGRRILGVHGPVETTVAATWTEPRPDRPVTLGRPLPSYAVVVLDPEHPDRALARGLTGEIGIAGIGLARGYLNRDEQTARAFVPDFLHLPGNSSGRIYRTGDLGLINSAGEIEYRGRVDASVAEAGHRAREDTPAPVSAGPRSVTEVPAAPAAAGHRRGPRLLLALAAALVLVTAIGVVALLASRSGEVRGSARPAPGVSAATGPASATPPAPGPLPRAAPPAGPPSAGPAASSGAVPPAGPAQLVLSVARVAQGSDYLATATRFQPGETVRISWTGPTRGQMGDFPADSQGSVVHGPIVENDPVGDYVIRATGLSSGRVSSAGLRVLP